MAAEVSHLLGVVGGYKEKQKLGSESGGEKSTSLVTKDLLGGSSMLAESQELDLDSQVPSGWEKMLDIKSGKVYIQRCQAPCSHSISDARYQNDQTVPGLQDLNFPPTQKLTLNLFDETGLDLKLNSSTSSNYTSVCTLDKVKSALERAEKEPVKKRSSLWKSSSSPSYSSSSSSMKEYQEDECDERMLSPPITAACSGCLSYVLVMQSNPRCPRCNSEVALGKMKKPRIDLNMSI